jgi:hypothetical protein
MVMNQVTSLLSYFSVRHRTSKVLPRLMGI